MEAVESPGGLSQKDRVQVLAESRKRETEIENKKRQLEHDKRQLQHLKSKALRERWLLDGAPSGGSEHDAVKKQLQEDECHSRGLEDNISRLEQEVMMLETGSTENSQHETMNERSLKEVRVHHEPHPDRIDLKVHHLSDGISKPLVSPSATDSLLKAVVHRVNGENAIHQLSSSEVEDLILKADMVSMETHSAPVGVPEENQCSGPRGALQRSMVEIRGLETNTGTGPEPRGELDLANASEESPLTMVFMGYQSVDDQDHTSRVLGLEGTVKAELVLIDDNNGKSFDCGPPEVGAAVCQLDAKAPEETQETPEGDVTEGDVTEGDITEGDIRKGDITEGDITEGDITEGDIREGDVTEGDVRKGDITEGDVRKGDITDGDITEINNKEKQPCKCCILM